MTDQVDFEAALNQLRLAFANKIPDKVAAIRQQWEALQAQPADANAFQLFYRSVHTLNGTGATYGFTELANQAEAIELIIIELKDRRPAWPAETISGIESEIATLEKLASIASADKEPVSEPSGNPTHAGPLSEHDGGSRLIYLVADDPDLLATLARQIGNFGYQTEVFADLARFGAALALHEPDVVIMSASIGNDSGAGIREVAGINETRGHPLRTIFIGGSPDLESRLAAVRANGLEYFPRPAQSEDLVEALDRLSHQEAEEPFRVLIVDDSAEQSAFAALTLQQAGMETMEVNKPLRLLEALAEFSPDLILMDIYMPDCSGLELSRVVRQMEAYVSTPIVFLSTEHDLERQLGALSLGGDDFLSKPVQPWHLVSAVSSRVQRGRLIRRLAETDGLTGLLNHTRSKQRLESELARARRENTPLSFAMLDVDHFKQVNDRYGHPAGDRVLKSLANMFRQRLRPYDTIGRYGGEEFVVILPGTGPEQAKAMMDKMRVRFAEISHYGGDEGSFFCSFSCGIAAFPGFDNGTRLGDEADKALYEAKNGGRNRVVVSLAG